MSETKHTPGPWVENWSIRTNNEPRRGWFVESESVYDRDTYGAIADLPDGRDNNEANARLIAAAPELLGALKAIMNGQIGGNPDIDAPRFQAARAAIAKAEGR